MSWAWTAVAVGTLIKVHSDQQVAKKQDSQLATQIQTQAKHQQDADSAVSDLITKTGQSNDNSARSSLMDNYVRQAQSASGLATGGLNQVGNVSDAYKSSGADAALGIADYGKKVADLTSRIDAPTLQRQDEQADRLRFGSNLGQISRDAAGDDFLAQMKLRSIRANPWLQIGASALTSAGASGLASGAGSSGGTGSAAGWWDPSGKTGWGGI